MRVAAIDIGTNSARLLVADVDDPHGELVTLDRRMTITRLGQGVDETRALRPDAIERTVAALREYREVDRRHGGVTAHPGDGDHGGARRDEPRRLLRSRGEVLGVMPELLSGEEEAAASFLGATATSPRSRRRRTSWSTSAVARPSSSSAPTEPEGLISVDIGCVRITEAWLHSDPPTAEELSQAVHVVREHWPT